MQSGSVDAVSHIRHLCKERMAQLEHQFKEEDVARNQAAQMLAVAKREYAQLQAALVAIATSADSGSGYLGTPMPMPTPRLERYGVAPRAPSPFNLGMAEG